MFPETLFLGELQSLPSKHFAITHITTQESTFLAPLEMYYFKRISHPVVMQKLLVGSVLHSLLKSLQNDPRIDEQKII